MTSLNSNLLTSNRLDVIFKYLFIKLRDKSPEFANQIYFDHIKIITNGLFEEKDNFKSSYEDFFNDFIKLDEKIKKQGFNSEISKIPLSKDGSIINGAHRLASSIYHGFKVDTLNTNEKRHNYNYEFFRIRALKNDILDYGILNYLELTKNNYLAIIWPSATKSVEFEHLFGDVLYKKEVNFNSLGAHNFLAQVYKDHKWIGDFENGYSGAITKLSEAFNNFSNVRCYFFKNDSFEDVLRIKNQIRLLFDIGKASIHITDDNTETLDLANYILNNNSIHFLNNAKPYKFKKVFNLLHTFNTYLTNHTINTDDIVIDGGLVLSLYGIRDSSDLDYLALTKIDFKNDFDHHISEIKYYKEEMGTLIYNPKFHFYFNGLKFISLKTLRSMKINRNQTKDKMDILLIDKVSKSSSFVFLKIKNSLVKFKFKFIAYLIPITKKLKIYNFSKYIYKLFN